MTSVKSKRYCLDTSSLIAAWQERYPIENFPKLWEYIELLILNGRVVIHTAVYDETGRGSKDLHAWLKKYTKHFIAFDTETQIEVKQILKDYPKLVAVKKQSFAADPFIIATAKINHLIVVTEEAFKTLENPHIPNVCNELKVPYINLIQLIREEKWFVS